MTERYFAHSQYADSGIEWLGALPSHWGVVDSRRLFSQRKDRMLPGDEQLTASQKYGVIPQAEFMRLEGQKVMQVFAGAEILKHVEPGDFVISMRSFQGGLEWCGYAGCVSSAYVGLTPLKAVVPGFFRYVFKSKPYIQALQSTSNLVRDGQALRYQNFAQVRLPVVDEDEQTQIAKFLDYETAKIDQLMDKQQQLIALLKEKRQAVISHAVTKGLSASAPMKDSGVEWLGEVPAHWEVTKLYHLTSRVGDGLHGTPQYEDGTGLYFVNGNNLDDGRLSIGSAREVPATEFERHKVPLSSRTVLLSINGTIGKVALYAGEPVILGKSAAYINCLHRFAPRFLRWFFETSSARRYYELVSTGTTISNLSLDSIRHLKVGVPSAQEQKAIIEYCDMQRAKYDGLVGTAIALADLLQERRTALISAAVTGKIDVRNWQPPEGEATQEVA